MRPIFNRTGFPIRKSADQFIFADPRGLSQLITSFIASESQGIPRVPFLTFFYAYAFCSYGMLFDSCCNVVRLQSWNVVNTSTYFFLPLNFTPVYSSPLYCCLLFQFTSSNMSKNVFSVCSSEFAVCSFNCLLPTVYCQLKAWRITDSNRWPSACKADALASWANPP